MLFARSIRENILLGLTNPKMVAGEVIPSAGYLAQKMHLTWLLGSEGEKCVQHVYRLYVM